MQPHHKHAATLACMLALGLSATAALAGSSSVASTASDSARSLSNSIQGSSESSSAHRRVAQGQYTIVAVAEVPQQPDTLRLHLQAQAPLAPQEFDLLVPRQTVARAGLALGDAVQAQHRPYGLAFATVKPAAKAEPFFLVLEDDWYRELESRPVVAL